MKIETENTESNNIDELMTLYLKCRDEKRRRAIHLKVVKKGMDLVKRLANPVAMQTGTSFEDLVQVGALGLMKAIDCYSPDRNAKFSTYATYYIKGELRHYIRDKVSIIKTPRKIQEQIVKVYNATKELKNNGIDEPSIQQIAELIDMPVGKVEDILKIDKYKFMVSLDQTASSEDDDVTLLERIPAGDYQEIQTNYENKLMVENAINKLPENLKQILRMSFFEELSQREIADELKISQMQVSRRLKRALNEMYNLIIRN